MRWNIYNELESHKVKDVDISLLSLDCVQMTLQIHIIHYILSGFYHGLYIFLESFIISRR